MRGEHEQRVIDGYSPTSIDRLFGAQRDCAATGRGKPETLGCEIAMDPREGVDGRLVGLEDISIAELERPYDTPLDRSWRRAASLRYGCGKALATLRVSSAGGSRSIRLSAVISA